jgi:uncharacterized membrane protein YphA (DoxX/SURF4 family)
MHPFRPVGRALFAGIFVYAGTDAVREPGPKAKKAAVVTEPMMRALGVSFDPQTLVRVNGAVQVGAGTLLALGRVPRLAATILAGSTLLTTLAGHRFWEEDDDGRRAQQTIHFFKNLAILGGLLEIVAAKRH